MNNNEKDEKGQQITGGLAKLGYKVITRISARPLGGSDSPNCVQSSPNFAKPLGCCTQVGRTVRADTAESKVDSYRQFDRTEKM